MPCPRLAAEHATSAQIVRLKECQRAFRAAIWTGDAAGRALANERFHSIIGKMAGNENLMPSLRHLLIDHTRISMTFYNPRHASFAAARELAADLAVAHWEMSPARIEGFVTPVSITMPLGRAPGVADTSGTS